VAVGGVAIESFGELAASAKVELHLAVDEQQEGRRLACVLTYAPGRYEGERMQRLARHYQRVLEYLVEAEPGAPLLALRLTEAGEREAVKELGRGAAVGVRGSVLEWIEAQASEWPERCALVGGEQRYSYEEMSRRSNQLGRYLQQLGVGVETRVAVYLERSVEFVLAVLGIWKAGAAYVPLDPEQPAERVARRCGADCRRTGRWKYRWTSRRRRLRRRAARRSGRSRGLRRWPTSCTRRVRRESRREWR
jgi:non-ribosomal peptide synthetase component F